MAHWPKNHPLRGLYRFLAFLAGVYCLAFGIVGVTLTHGRPFFSQAPMWALGLRTNLAFSVASIAIGLFVIAILAINHNRDHVALLWLGPLYMLVGLVMLTVLRSGANILNFEVATCIVSFIIGIVLFAGGMYTEVAPESVAHQEEAYRHSRTERENVPFEQQPQR